MMKHLGVKVVSRRKYTITVSIAEAPGVVIYIDNDKIEQWCLNRINSRKDHKNKAIRRQGFGSRLIDKIGRSL